MAASRTWHVPYRLTVTNGGNKDIWWRSPHSRTHHHQPQRECGHDQGLPPTWALPNATLPKSLGPQHKRGHLSLNEVYSRHKYFQKCAADRHVCQEGPSSELHLPRGEAPPQAETLRMCPGESLQRKHTFLLKKHMWIHLAHQLTINSVLHVLEKPRLLSHEHLLDATSAVRSEKHSSQSEGSSTAWPSPLRPSGPSPAFRKWGPSPAHFKGQVTCQYWAPRRLPHPGSHTALSFQEPKAHRGADT